MTTYLAVGFLMIQFLMYSMKQVLTQMYVHLKFDLNYYYYQVEEKKEALANLEIQQVKIQVQDIVQEAAGPVEQPNCVVA